MVADGHIIDFIIHIHYSYLSDFILSTFFSKINLVWTVWYLFLFSFGLIQPSVFPLFNLLFTGFSPNILVSVLLENCDYYRIMYE